MNRAKGFTLIELLIVLAIILIIAAIAIPSLVHMKINANEASAIASIKAIQTAQMSYLTTYRTYASSLAALGGGESCAPSPDRACLLDEELASGEKAGYSFAVVAGNPVRDATTTYAAGAAPLSYNHTGVRRFCSTEKNIMRTDTNTAGSVAPPTAEECVQFRVLH